MSDIILKSGLRDRNTMRISMDADGDMTLSLDTYVGSAAFHIASQAQIKQLRDYFDSHLAQPAAPQVGGAMVQRALDAKVAEGETVFWSIVFGLNKDSESTRAIMAKEIIRTALKAALSQPGEGE